MSTSAARSVASDLHVSLAFFSFLLGFEAHFEHSFLVRYLFRHLTCITFSAVALVTASQQHLPASLSSCHTEAEKARNSNYRSLFDCFLVCPRNSA
jgi:hypothetical protein